MDEFFNILNSAHKSINFTIEKENNDELALFDVQIKRKKKFAVEKENFYRMLFQFPIKLQFKEKSKFNQNFVSCAHKICSPELLISEINHMKLLLNKNSYLQELVNKTINLHLKKKLIE